MAANIKTIAHALMFATTLTTLTASSASELDQIPEAEVVAYLKQKTEEKLSALNRRIAECDQIRDATKLTITPEEVSDAFRKFGLSKSQALYAVMSHGGQNSERCYYREAADLSHALNVLDKLGRETKVDIKVSMEEAEYTIDELRDLVVTDKLLHYRIAILYNHLPPSIIEFMDAKFGTAPFRTAAFVDALVR